MEKANRKRKKNLNYSENESQMVDLDQKRELQKCDETLKPHFVTATASNVSLRVIGACGENKSMFIKSTH